MSGEAPDIKPAETGGKPPEGEKAGKETPQALQGVAQAAHARVEQAEQLAKQQEIIQAATTILRNQPDWVNPGVVDGELTDKLGWKKTFVASAIEDGIQKQEKLLNELGINNATDQEAIGAAIRSLVNDFLNYPGNTQESGTTYARETLKPRFEEALKQLEEIAVQHGFTDRSKILPALDEFFKKASAQSPGLLDQNGNLVAASLKTLLSMEDPSQFFKKFDEYLTAIEQKPAPGTPAENQPNPAAAKPPESGSPPQQGVENPPAAQNPPEAAPSNPAETAGNKPEDSAKTDSNENQSGLMDRFSKNPIEFFSDLKSGKIGLANLLAELIDWIGGKIGIAGLAGMLGLKAMEKKKDWEKVIRKWNPTEAEKKEIEAMTDMLEKKLSAKYLETLLKDAGATRKILELKAKSGHQDWSIFLREKLDETGIKTLSAKTNPTAAEIVQTIFKNPEPEKTQGNPAGPTV